MKNQISMFSNFISWKSLFEMFDRLLGSGVGRGSTSKSLILELMSMEAG
jgi:hypothetical protein